MLSISPVSINNFSNSIQKPKNSRLSSIPVDSVNFSFKANDVQEEDDLDTSLFGFFIRLKVDRRLPEILNKAETIKYSAGIEQNYAKSVIGTRLKKLEQVIAKTPELIEDNGVDKSFSEYDGNCLKSVTTFTTDENGINIKRVDIVNRDGTKDIILTDGKNDVYGIRLGVKQIAPKSYLQRSELIFKNGQLVSYCDSISCVNDGNAKSKVKTKKNFYRFNNGLLSTYTPDIEFIGKDSFCKKFYLFKDGKIRKYMEELHIENGKKLPNLEFTF